MEEQRQQVGQVHKAILAIIKEMGAVGKDGKNEQQNYNFRSAAAVVAACKPLLSKHDLYVAPNRILSDECGKGPNDKGFRVRQRIVYRFTHIDGSFVDVEVTGEGVDYGDKASNKCMTVSFKYALCETFCIPDYDQENDPDFHSPENGPPKGQRQQGEGKPAEEPKAGKQPVNKVLQAKRETVSAAMDKAGIPKADKVGWLSIKLNRQIKSAADLTSEDCEKALEALKSGKGAA
jgi:hypothetical protein